MTRSTAWGALLLLAVLFSNVQAHAPPPYHGVDMPTPWGWEVTRVNDRSFAFIRAFHGPGGAFIVAEARPATDEDIAFMRSAARCVLPKERMPGWEYDVHCVKNGYAIVRKKDGRAVGQAAILVMDGKGSSFVHFDGTWPTRVQAFVLLAARTVLGEIRNR